MLATALFEERCVGHHEGQRLGHIDVDPLLGRGDPGQRGRNDLFEGDRTQDQFHGAGLEPAHVEQVADHAIEPVGRGLDVVEQHATIIVGEGHVGVKQSGGRRLDGGERRTEIVRDRGATPSAAPSASATRSASAASARKRLASTAIAN